MSATVRQLEPEGAVCELRTDEPVHLVTGRMRAYGVKGCKVVCYGQRRWLVACGPLEPPADHIRVVVLAEDETPNLARSRPAETVALIGAAVVLAGIVAGAMGLWL